LADNTVACFGRSINRIRKYEYMPSDCFFCHQEGDKARVSIYKNSVEFAVPFIFDYRFSIDKKFQLLSGKFSWDV
jgi:hypothetical protein